MNESIWRMNNLSGKLSGLARLVGRGREMEMKEIHLPMSVEEFEVLRTMMDETDLNTREMYPDKPFASLYEKVVEIGKRLDFFKEKKERPSG